jgi:hypothetical protein
VLQDELAIARVMPIELKAGLVGDQRLKERLALTGMGATEIANAVGCKRGNVYKALKAAGLS